MTFRARDNATALELVERRFGGDALILSTVYADGQVEITATDEAPPPAKPNAGFPARSRRQIDVTLDEPVSLNTTTPEIDPKPMRESGQGTGANALPSFLRRPAPPHPFAEVMDAAKQGVALQDIPAPKTPSARPIVGALRTKLLQASRIVLVGPCGAGKTQVALQLALLLRAQRPQVRTKFVFCGTGSRADGAVLAQKSHLLGMTTVFKKSADLDAPAQDETEIVLLSGRVIDAPQQARGLLGAPGAQTLLVLPDGLRTERLSRLIAQWRDITTWTAVGNVAVADRSEAETALATAAGLDLLWLSDPDALVDGLCPVGPDHPAPQVVFRSQKMKSEVRP
jgi:energy-coupling factor transporter ATP-binding protein EcfA2